MPRARPPRTCTQGSGPAPHPGHAEKLTAIGVNRIKAAYVARYCTAGDAPPSAPPPHDAGRLDEAGHGGLPGHGRAIEAARHPETLQSRTGTCEPCVMAARESVSVQARCRGRLGSPILLDPRCHPDGGRSLMLLAGAVRGMPGIAIPVRLHLGPPGSSASRPSPGLAARGFALAWFRDRPEVARLGRGSGAAGRLRRNTCCERQYRSAPAPSTWCGVHARRCRRDRRCPAGHGRCSRPGPGLGGVREPAATASLWSKRRDDGRNTACE